MAPTPANDYAALAAADQRCLWHPFTQMREYEREPPLIIASGDGVWLTDVQGRRYYDGVSSIWLNVHGHRVPEIDAAIRAQLDRIAHSTLLGQANVPAIQLAERLVALAPPGLARVFYSDSGAEAVEIALKMAFQYWRLRGQPGRRVFIRMADAYHGDTIGAVSIGGIDLFHAAYRELLFPTVAAPFPDPHRFAGGAAACRDACLARLAELLIAHAGEVIGVVVEPIVQGAAGIIVAPPGYLAGVRDLCRQHDTLLLADEVATGFGRTGRMFACDHEGVTPDLMMVGKGLTGGYLPLAATLATDEVYRAFLGEYAERKTFFHGHSYTGNQLACAAALANLELMAQRDLVRQVAAHGAWLADELAPLTAQPHVGQVRGRGLMWGVELVRDRATKEPYAWEERLGWQVCWRCRELGMLLRPLGSVVVFMPPLASTRAELAAMAAILRQAIADVTGT